MSAADKLTESLFKTMQRFQQMLGEHVKQVSTNMDGSWRRRKHLLVFFGNPRSNSKGILLIKKSWIFSLEREIPPWIHHLLDDNSLDDKWWEVTGFLPAWVLGSISWNWKPTHFSSLFLWVCAHSAVIGYILWVVGRDWSKVFSVAI